MPYSPLNGANFATTSGLLTATGPETVHDTTVAISYCINGKAYSKAAITDGATPTTDFNTSAAFTALTADKGCVFVWGLNSAGAVKVVQGPIENMDGDTDLFKVSPQFPDIPDTITPFAYQVITLDGTASSWTFGSSNWNATGVTSAIQNVMVLPDRPQES